MNGYDNCLDNPKMFKYILDQLILNFQECRFCFQHSRQSTANRVYDIWTGLRRVDFLRPLFKIFLPIKNFPPPQDVARKNFRVWIWAVFYDFWHYIHAFLGLYNGSFGGWIRRPLYDQAHLKKTNEDARWYTLFTSHVGYRDELWHCKSM